MKCLSCDVILTPFEATRKYKSTMEPVDLCNRCFKPISDQVPVVIRPDLINTPSDDDLEWGDGEEELMDDEPL